jgi:hypothetical protein
MSNVWDKLDDDSVSSAKPNRSNKVSPDHDLDSKQKEEDMINLASYYFKKVIFYRKNFHFN